MLLILILLPVFVTFLHYRTQTQQHAASNTSDPSGEAMPVGDIPGWHQVFADDFTTDVPLGSFPSAIANRWKAYPDGSKDTSGNGTYYPSKVVSIQNGVMNVYVHTENGVHMVAAVGPILPNQVGSSQLYGRYAIRFKADPVPGYKTAWLLWPDSEVWPRDGEIDFPEGGLASNICGYMHYQNGTSGGDQDKYCTPTTYTSWHTAVIEWLPTRLTFLLDGQVVGNSTSRIPNTPMHWVIQTETSLASVPTDTAAGNVQIDWVAMYSPSGTPPTSPTLTSSPSPTNTPVPTQTSTPTPVPFPTMTPVPTPMPTLTSHPTPTTPPLPTGVPTIANGSSLLLLTVCPHGLGNCGDSMHPTGGGNTNPLHPQRPVTLTIFDTNNNQVAKQQGTVSYNQAAQNFQGTVSLTNLASGNYLVKLHMDGFLDTLVPGIQSIKASQTNTIPTVSLIAGDVENNNQLDIQSYNTIFSCYGSKFTTAACLSKEADLNDDGVVDGEDYNLFLRELSVQHGE